MFGKTYINKLFIDSRFKKSYSKSNSDFIIEINENLELGENIGCIVTDITLPHTWYNINSNLNSFYFRTIVNSTWTDYMVTLPSENYNFFNLRDRLEELMNAAVGSTAFDVQADVQAGTLTISILNSGWVFSDNELTNQVNGTWRGPFYDINNLKSINDMIRINGSTFQIYDTNNSFKTGFIDLLAYHSIYLTSTKLSNYSNLGPGDQRNVLKKIVVNSSFGEVNVFEGVWSDDKVNVSNLSLKLIDFQLTDAFGNIIDLNGSHVSFSILFVKM